MKRILIATELGGNRGHVTRIGHVLSSLSGRGYDIEIAASDILAFAGRAERVWQAPLCSPMLKMGKTATDTEGRTHAGMLLGAGLGLTGQISAGIKAWESIIDAVKPDLLILDYAPLLRITTVGRIPGIVIGNGYLVPPIMNPLPNMISGEITESERTLEKQLAEEAPRSGMTCAADILSGDHRIILTDQELDIFSGVRDEEVTQPFSSRFKPSHKSGKNILIYSHGRISPEMPFWQVISKMPGKKSAYIDQASRQHHEAMKRYGIDLQPQPIDLQSMAPKAGLLISHGGHGTATAGLRLGIPQTVFYYDAEKQANGECLARAGVGGSMHVAHHRPEEIQRLLGSCIEARPKALEVANRIFRTRKTSPQEILLSSIESALS